MLQAGNHQPVLHGPESDDENDGGAAGRPERQTTIQENNLEAKGTTTAEGKKLRHLGKEARIHRRFQVLIQADYERS